MMIEKLRVQSKLRGETLAQAVRHHVMDGLVERLARVDPGGAFVLRGGLLTRVWVAPAHRPTRDLDYVGDFAFSVDETVRRFTPAVGLVLADEVVFDESRVHAEGIWLATEFPGVRLTVPCGLGAVDGSLSLDIGFRDPLVPAAIWRDTPWSVPVRTIRPETQIAWKLHALAEMGASFRPKDIADLALIAAHVPLEEAAIPPAIVAAFESRGYTLAQARDVLFAEHWGTKTARVRWSQTRSTGPELADALATIRTRLAPALAALVPGAQPSP